LIALDSGDRHRSEHMSGDRTFQVLDVSPARTRRTWSRAGKEMIVAEASAPGANVSAVARAHGASVQQVFRWRRVTCP
jgi:transposase